MTKRSLLIAAASGFIVFAPAAYGRSAYDGSWDLVFVTNKEEPAIPVTALLSM
jgi:hypothetical protein